MSDGIKRGGVWACGFFAALAVAGLFWVMSRDGSVPAEPIVSPPVDEPVDVPDDEPAPDPDPEPEPEPAVEAEPIYTTASAMGERRLDPHGTLLAYEGGYLSVRQEYEPTDLVLADVLPDVADRFPDDIHEALAAAELEIGTADLEQVEAVLAEAGLLEKVSWIVGADPELYGAVAEVTTGGVWVPVAERSDDGLTWEPMDVGLPGGQREAASWYSSNGTHVVVAVADESRLRLFTSADLDVWVEVELPPMATGLPDYVTSEIWMTGLAVSADGWYVEAYLSTTISPSDVLPSGTTVGLGTHWLPVPEGIVITDTVDGNKQTVPWSAMSITYEEWREIERDDLRQAYVGDFVGGVEEAARPGLGCCQVIPTSDGFFAWGLRRVPTTVTLEELVPDIADRLPPEVLAALAASGEAVSTVTIDESVAILDDADLLHLWSGVINNDPVVGDAFFRLERSEWAGYASPDGRAWVEATLPSVDRVAHVGAVEGGLVAIGSDEEGGAQRYFLHDEAAGWAEIDGPDAGADSLWFGPSSGDGFGVVFDLGADSDPQAIPWQGSTRYEGLEFTVRGDETGATNATIVDIATGEVLLDRTVQDREEGLWLTREDTIDFHAADGSFVASIPSIGVHRDEIFDAQYDAYQAWSAEHPFVPQPSLIVTRDGQEWHVVGVELAEGELFTDAPVLVDGGVVLFATYDAWHRVELP